MNKNGQSLVVFILLIPLILIIGAFIVDNSLLAYKSNELKNLTKEVISSHIDDEEINKNLIIDYYKKNDINLEQLEISQVNGLSVYCNYNINSIFGKIIKINSYEVSANITGYKKDGKVIFKNR